MSKNTIKIFTFNDRFKFILNSSMSALSTIAFVKMGYVSVPAIAITAGLYGTVVGGVLTISSVKKLKNFGWICHGFSLTKENLLKYPKSLLLKKKKPICSVFEKAKKALEKSDTGFHFPEIVDCFDLMKMKTFSFFDKHSIDATAENLSKYDGFPQLLDISKTLAKSMGLKKAPELKIFKSNSTDKELGSLAMLRRIPNAMVYNTNTGSECMLTIPLLEMLEDSEEVVVVGHEIGHVAGRHAHQKMIISAPSAITSLATTAVSAFALLTSWTGIFSLSSAYVAKNMVENSCKNKPISKDTSDLLQKFASAGVMLTMPVLLGQPHLSALWATSKTASVISSLISNGSSRIMEFHADRLSAKATHKPLDLVSALEKISKDPDIKFVGEASSKTNGFVKSINDLFRTHPSVEERRKALVNINNKMQQKASLA